MFSVQGVYTRTAANILTACDVTDTSVYIVRSVVYFFAHILVQTPLLCPGYLS